MKNNDLAKDYPWVKQPLVASAPMRLIALAPLTAAVTQAGGLGFIGAGSDVRDLSKYISETKTLLSHDTPIPTADPDVLPFGAGFLLWGAPLEDTLEIISKPGNILSAVWLFAPRDPAYLRQWSEGIRKATSGKTRIWIQVASVAEALDAVRLAAPDVLVVQGQDAGGHGGAQGAGLTSLLPETIDAVTAACKDSSSKLPTFIATGGIGEGRGLAASIALGAEGIVMGTRYLGSHEATIAKGYQGAVLRAFDGGISTIRSSVYDTLRGTTDWPSQYGGRGIVNASFRDAQAGMQMDENKKLYEAALKTGDQGWEGDKARLTAYAGTGVGLVKDVVPAADITRQVREDGIKFLSLAASRLSSL
ncbi:hypothetical protein MBLNU459_g0236t1 [Dothideomycetes sp. NU459]